MENAWLAGEVHYIPEKKGNLLKVLERDERDLLLFIILQVGGAKISIIVSAAWNVNH